MPVQHVKNVTIGDGTDTNRVRPSDWNSGHNIEVGIAGNSSGGSTAGGSHLIVGAYGGLGASANGNTLNLWGYGGANEKRFANMLWPHTTNYNPSDGSWTRPIVMPGIWMPNHGLIPKTIRFIGSHPGSSNRTLVQTMRVALYRYNNSTQISMWRSTSQNWSLVSSAGKGLLFIDFTGITDSLPAGMIWLAVGGSNAADNTASGNLNLYGASRPWATTFERYIKGGATSSTPTVGMQVFPFNGRHTAATAGFPASIGSGDIDGIYTAQLWNLYYQLLEE